MSEMFELADVLTLEASAIRLQKVWQRMAQSGVVNKITCGELAALLAKQPQDKPIKFALNGADNTQDFIDFDECFDTHAAYWIALREKQ